MNESQTPTLASKRQGSRSVRDSSRRDKDPLSLSWFTHLALSYATCTLLLHQLIGGPALAALWSQQVPQTYHILSSAAFGTAFMLDLLAVAFYSHTSRLQLTLLPAWIKGLPTLSSILMATGRAVVAEAASGKLVNLQRYVCWMHTTPAVLYLIKTVSTRISSKQMYGIILLHELQLGCGMLAKLSGGWVEVGLGLFAHLALLPVVLFLHQGLKELGAQYSKNIARFTYLSILLTYVSFGVVWDLDLFRLLDPATEEALYLLAELASKIMFSTVLLFSNFVTADLRRLHMMRGIESAGKQQLITELKQLMAQKDAFMSSVSHELRTPLNGIIGLSEAAMHNSDAAAAAAAQQQPGVSGSPLLLHPATRQQFALIRTSGLRLLSLVNDILDATALEHKRLTLSRSCVVLRPLLEEVADITRPLLRGRPVRLVTHVPHDIEALGDPDRIVQVLNNLVSNAVKFTESGTITISAHVSRTIPAAAWRSSSSTTISSSTAADRSLAAQSSVRQKVVVVSVTDTGLGIPEEKLKAIFLPFEQVHIHESRTKHGLGLGLSIVQQLVSAMGGSITASSTVGSGSTFSFTLPYYTPQAAAAARAADEAIAAATAAAGRKTPPATADADMPGLSTAAATEGSIARVAMSSSDGNIISTVAPGGERLVPAGSTGYNVTSSGSSGVSNVPGSLSSGGRAANNDPADLVMPATAAGGGGGGVGSLALTPPAAAMAAVAPPAGHAALRVAAAQHTENSAVAAAAPPPAVAAVCSGSTGSADRQQQQQQQISMSRVASGADAAAAAAVPINDSGSLQQQQMLRSPSSSSIVIPATQFHSENQDGKLQILVVDDDTVNHQVLSLLLESAGFSLVHVMSGAATVAYLSSCKLLPDLVLLDVAMPGMDGRETCRRIRAAMAGSSIHLPVVMLTAQVSAQALEDSLAAGADDHLAKPCTRDELMAVVARNIRKQHKP